MAIRNIKLAARAKKTGAAPDVHLAWYEKLIGSIVALFMGGF